MAIKLILLFLFFSSMVGVGFYCRKKATDVNGFILGGRSVGPWLSAFAYGTSYFSAVVFVGYAGQFGWKFGVAATWIGIGNALLGSLLAWSILGRRTRIISQHLNCSTMPEFFGKRFASDYLEIAAAVIIFVFLIPYTASLYNGLSRLFEMAFSLPYELCILIMAILTAVYVISGGYMATAINDFIQGIIMLFGICTLVVAVLRVNGGFTASLAALARIDNGQSAPGIFTSFFGPNPADLLTIICLTSLGTWGLPQMVQKFYAIEDENAIQKGTVISTLFALVVAGGCYFLGGFGRLFLSDATVAAEGYDAIIPAMLSSMPDALIGIVIILVLSASMSTLSSLVLTSGTTITLDLIQHHIIKDLSKKRQLFFIRVFIAIFIAISVFIAIVQYRTNAAFIAQLMGISWGTLAGAFFAPFLYGLYWRGASKLSCWCCFIFSVGIMTAHLFMPQIFPAWLGSSIHAGVFCMLCGLIIVPVVSAVSPKPPKELVDDVFMCLNTPVIVSQKEALGKK